MYRLIISLCIMIMLVGLAMTSKAADDIEVDFDTNSELNFNVQVGPITNSISFPIVGGGDAGCHAVTPDTTNGISIELIDIVLTGGLTEFTGVSYKSTDCTGTPSTILTVSNKATVTVPVPPTLLP